MQKQDTNIERLLQTRGEIDLRRKRPRRMTAILFTDVAGTMAYFEKYGGRDASKMRHRHSTLAASLISEFHGRVVLTYDDSLMAEFHDPDLAVHAAVQLQRRLNKRNATQADYDRILLRIGIHYGHCFKEDDDLYGEAVDFAARVTEHTGPGQILITRSVRDMVDFESGFRCIWLGPLRMPGKSDREDIFEVIWTDPAAYSEMRLDATVAFARGEITSPGVRPDDLLKPATTASNLTPVQPRPSIPPAPKSPVPTSLTERYAIVAEIGSGATGVVYRARDRETGETVALKVLRNELLSDPQILRRFKNELKAARMVSHRNVCRIYDFHRTEDAAFISMELVPGETLRQVLKRFGSLPLRDGLRIAVHMCDGLREAHSRGVIHRDLKPENVMVTLTGEGKLMDFGIARAIGGTVTQLGQMIGTAGYLAPELVEARPADHRVDIYALGLIMYEIFTGVPAFTGETPLAVAIKHVRDVPKMPRELVPSLPEELESVIMKCLEKNPDARFATAEELFAALDAIQKEFTEEEDETPVEGASEPSSIPVPWGANQSQPYVNNCNAHAGPVYALAFHPDGRWLASASEDRSIRIWERGALKEKLRLQCHSYALAFSPDGKLLASGSSSKGLRVWVIPSGRELHNLEGHTKHVRSVVFSPDGSRLVSTSQDATVRVWDVSSGKLLMTLPGHTSGVYAADISPDGQSLATGSTDKNIKIWDMKTGGEIRTLTSKAGGVYGLAFSPDGTLLATAHSERKIKIWEVATGRALRSLSGHTGGVYSVAFSPDGHWLISGSGDSDIKVWEAGTARLGRTLSGHTGPVWDVAVSPDGRWLASASEDSTFKLW
ncbi:MAG: protein kinase [Acidobacteria bacterium]|nr:protein kinase [Acidobacteriota bacterium]